MSMTFQIPTMTRYRNRSGRSGIAAFAFMDDGIVVRFADGGTYLYGPTRPGRHHVGQMKSLAMAGEGLNTYISRYVREKFEAQL